MTYTPIRIQLAQVDRNIVANADAIDRQCAVIDMLERNGIDTSSARQLLQLYEEAQTVQYQYREHLFWQLPSPAIEQQFSGACG